MFSSRGKCCIVFVLVGIVCYVASCSESWVLGLIDGYLRMDFFCMIHEGNVSYMVFIANDFPYRFYPTSEK